MTGRNVFLHRPHGTPFRTLFGPGFGALSALSRPEARPTAAWRPDAILVALSRPDRNYAGPAVDTATRLRRTAEPGTVVVSREAVPGDLPDGVTLEVLDEGELQDLDRPIERLRVGFGEAG